MFFVGVSKEQYPKTDISKPGGYQLVLSRRNLRNVEQIIAAHASTVCKQMERFAHNDEFEYKNKCCLYDIISTEEVVMPLFKLDQDTLNTIRYALAAYKFRNYLSGFTELSAYLTGLCFERIIIQTGRKFPELDEKVRRGRYLRVEEVIIFLRNHGQIGREEEGILRGCWNFRGDIMHGVSGMSKDEIAKGTKKVLRKICSMVKIGFEEQLESMEFEDILRFGERKRQVARFRKIVASDFCEFNRLYDKCFAFQQELHRTLSLRLLSEEISEFVPNTGGIWLPWVTRKIPPRRAHVHRVTLGVTFTPNNIRIGLDFGSRAHKFKKKYYELLSERELDEELQRLQRENKPYSFYDTFWYYNIRNIRPIEWYFKADDKSIQEIKSALEEVKLLNVKPMTANRLLVGRIVSRESKEFPRVLEKLFEVVSSAFNEIYPIITKIESEA